MFNSERGHIIVEYALLIVLIAIVVVVNVAVLKVSILR
jgi:Flp pilus assembly pilin Flp